MVKKQGAEPLRVEDQETGAVCVFFFGGGTRLGGVTQGKRGSLCHTTEEGALGATHSGTELCWGCVWRCLRPGDGTKWSDDSRCFCPRKREREIRLS